MRLYRWLLKLFPRPFRDRFERDMADVFRDHWRAARRRGMPATLLLLSKTTADVLIHAIAERRAASRRTPTPIQRGRLVDHFLQDVRFAIRSAARRRGFTTAALLTIALGIGANTAIFSVVRPLLLEPPPFPASHRIVRVFETTKNRPDDYSVANPSNFDGWEKHTEVFEALGGHSGARATLTGAGDPEQLQLASVTPGYFSVFGVRPMLGRTFNDDDVQADARVIVLSHALWRSKFGGDRGLIERTITLDDQPWRVLGVMPSDFMPATKYGWVPLDLTPALRRNRNTRFLGVVAKLRPGITMERANAVTDSVLASLAATYPGFNRDRTSRVVGWQEDRARPVRRGLWMLQGAALVVLLIAGANLSNLMLAQAAGRSREFSVRMALGAGRRRVVRQVVTEGLVLAGAGGAAGVLIAVWMVPAIAALAPTWLPQADALSVGLTDVAAGLALAGLTGALFSVVPAILVTRRSAAYDALASRGTSPGRRQQRVRALLVTTQVGLALLLLSGAALLVRSFDRLTSQAIGFDPTQILTAELSLPPLSYDSEDKRSRLIEQLTEALNHHPAVVSAAASTALPFTWWEWMDDFTVLGRAEKTQVGSAFRMVTPRYFETLRIPIVRGRGFESTDNAGAPRVALVNEAFVRKHAALGDVFGLTLAREGDNSPISVIGVVGDTRHRSFERPAQAELYFPASQWGPRAVTFAVRTVGRPDDAAAVMRQTLSALDPNLPIAEVRSLDAWVAAAVAERRFYMWLLTLFSGLAVVLAVVGIYGVMAYVVRLRIREMSIRIALGASAREVTQLLVRQGMLPVALGIGAGGLATWFATTLLRDQLFQIDARDPATLLSVAAVLLAAAIVACWVPSRHTSRVDPAAVLQAD